MEVKKTMSKYCVNCGGENNPGAKFCALCGAEMSPTAPPTNQEPQYQQNTYSQPEYQQAQPVYANQSGQINDPNRKDRVAAAIFGIILGGIGVHKFYLGNIGMGILYLIFCWTGIPSLIGFIEGIIYLTENDEEFHQKHVLPILQR
ncbi:hypothetical protein NEF87_003358 [Candidatus Lokiarchaeum ossiferum]|uniref:TM2 domain-containing protein n=1 Tax=Candidatus Lokiarchaeum ossiferum TaxID=2951803 RepID=A0ABY6HUP5_9ARCH|nr:hypothetical protein NEF87_003358 [Candidatus Lokiarchaeum sp. B-35]